MHPVITFKDFMSLGFRLRYQAMLLNREVLSKNVVIPGNPSAEE